MQILLVDQTPLFEGKKINTFMYLESLRILTYLQRIKCNPLYFVEEKRNVYRGCIIFLFWAKLPKAD